MTSAPWKRRTLGTASTKIIRVCRRHLRHSPPVFPASSSSEGLAAEQETVARTLNFEKWTCVVHPRPLARGSLRLSLRRLRHSMPSPRAPEADLPVLLLPFTWWSEGGSFGHCGTPRSMSRYKDPESSLSAFLFRFLIIYSLTFQTRPPPPPTSIHHNSLPLKEPFATFSY